MPPEAYFVEMVLLPILGMGLGAGFLYGVYRTVNRTLERRHERFLAREGGPPSGQLEELQRRIETLEDVAFRVQDLEERLEFAERVLTRDAKAGGLPPGAER